MNKIDTHTFQRFTIFILAFPNTALFPAVRPGTNHINCEELVHYESAIFFILIKETFYFKVHILFKNLKCSVVNQVGFPLLRVSVGESQPS